MEWSIEYAAAVTTITAMMLSLVTALLLGLFFRKKWRNCDVYPPGAATMVDHILNFKRIHDFFYDRHRRFKTFRIAYPTFSMVCTTDPADVEHMLKTNFANYIKGDSIHQVMEDLLGDGIFNVDGVDWWKQRKLSSLEFSTRQLRDYSSVVFRENALKLSKILLEVYQTKQGTVEMQRLFLRSTMDGISKFAFGLEVNSLSMDESGPGATFSKAFDTANGLLFARHYDPTWKLKRYFNIGSEVIVKKCMKIVDDFVYDVIRSRRHEISLQTINVKPDLLSRFMEVTDSSQGDYSVNDKYLRDIIINFMIAGRDTTATTLSWFFHMLSKSPGVEKMILQEIRELVKEKECVPMEETVTRFCESLTHTVLDKMHYLHAALSEALRLYPPIAQDGKVAVADDILPDGYKINKGDILVYVPYSMGRMRYLWGTDADEFRPERWLQNGVFKPESPFKFTAFQAGPRVCLGKDFAYMQMKIVAAALIRFFEFEGIEGEEVTYSAALTLQMAGEGLNLQFKPRLDF